MGEAHCRFFPCAAQGADNKLELRAKARLAHLMMPSTPHDVGREVRVRRSGEASGHHLHHWHHLVGQRHLQQKRRHKDSEDGVLTVDMRSFWPCVSSSGQQGKEKVQVHLYRSPLC